MAKDSMVFKLFGQDISLSKAFKHAGGEADKFASKSKSALGGIGKGLAIGAGAIVGAGGTIAAAGMKSINTFEATGKESLKLQRYMGGTIEDASRLGHAFTMTGVDTEMAAKALGIFSKNSVNAGQSLNEYESKQAAALASGKPFKDTLKGSAAAFAELGVKIRGPKGEMLNMGEMLPEVAEQFKGMESGPEKTALALKLFGKSGMAMMPFLNKGAAGIKDLMTESDKLGTTLNTKDAQAVKDSIKNKRQMGEAMKGLQISIGKNLLPIFQKFVTWITEHLIPVIGKVVKWFQDNRKTFENFGKALFDVALIIKDKVAKFIKDNQPFIEAFIGKIQDLGKFIKSDVLPAIADFGGWLVKYQGWLIPVAAGVLAIVAAIKIYAAVTRIISAVTKIWTAIQAAWNAVMLMNPLGLIILAIVGLVVAIVVAYKRSETFRKVVDGAFRWVLKTVKAVWHWIKDNWKLLLAIITGPIGIAVLLITRHWDKIKAGAKSAVKWVTDKFNGLLSFFKSLPKKLSDAVKNLWDGLKSGFKDVVNFLIDGWNSIDFGISLKIPDWIPGVGGKGFSVEDVFPDIPRLAAGGIATQATIAMIGEAGPEAVVPLSKLNGLGLQGTTNIYLQPQVMVGSEDQMARAMVKALNDYQRKGGRLAFLGAS